MLVRIDHDRVRLAQPVVRAPRRGAEVVGEAEVAAVGGIGMEPEPVALTQLDQLRQRVHRADRGGTDGRHHRADAA